MGLTGEAIGYVPRALQAEIESLQDQIEKLTAERNKQGLFLRIKNEQAEFSALEAKTQALKDEHKKIVDKAKEEAKKESDKIILKAKADAEKSAKDAETRIALVDKRESEIMIREEAALAKEKSLSKMEADMIEKTKDLAYRQDAHKKAIMVAKTRAKEISDIAGKM